MNYPYFQSWYLRFRLHCHIYPLKFFTGSISKSFNSSSFLLFSCNSKKYQPFLKMLSLPISFISENTFYIISYSISLFRYVATFYRMLQSSYWYYLCPENYSVTFNNFNNSDINMWYFLWCGKVSCFMIFQHKPVH